IEPPRAGLVLGVNAVAQLKTTFWRNNVLEAAPERAASATLEDAPVTLIGTWFDRAVTIEDGTWRTGLARLRPNWSVLGRWPAEDAAEVAVGRRWAERHRVRVGDRLTARIAADGVPRGDRSGERGPARGRARLAAARPARSA